MSKDIKHIKSEGNHELTFDEIITAIKEKLSSIINSIEEDETLEKASISVYFNNKKAMHITKVVRPQSSVNIIEEPIESAEIQEKEEE